LLQYMFPFLNLVCTITILSSSSVVPCCSCWGIWKFRLDAVFVWSVSVCCLLLPVDAQIALAVGCSPLQHSYYPPKLTPTTSPSRGAHPLFPSRVTRRLRSVQQPQQQALVSFNIFIGLWGRMYICIHGIYIVLFNTSQSIFLEDLVAIKWLSTLDSCKKLVVLNCCWCRALWLWRPRFFYFCLLSFLRFYKKYIAYTKFCKTNSIPPNEMVVGYRSTSNRHFIRRLGSTAVWNGSNCLHIFKKKKS
jgi:hypothetical protein